MLVVYYEPETSVGLNPKQPFRDYALQLTRRGFVTLSIGTPGGNAWKPETGARFASRFPITLTSRQIAGTRWRIFRKSIASASESWPQYGGKWSMFAAALYDKFAAVAMSDPGIVFDEKRPNVNYWEPWYLGLDSQSTAKAGNSSPRKIRAPALTQDDRARAVTCMNCTR